ncbi:MAG: enoyl-CoA hydratase/isomerase family protein [Casimicrobiaceae bacterium]
MTRLDVDLRRTIAVVTLNRPEVHNAFDQALVRELTAVLKRLERDVTVRAVVLAGAGKSFCAGADLNWMREMATFSRAQNLADAGALARMLDTLNRLSKPTIARVHGAAYGGGVGLVACCDVAFGAAEASFALSEGRLGLIPATVGPYVIDAIGARAARRYFLTGERFDAQEACRLGLLHDLAPLPELDARINDVLGALLITGPVAQAESKDLIRAVARRPIDGRLIAGTARRIARVRASPEAREGIAAFLGKRKASWVPQGE